MTTFFLVLLAVALVAVSAAFVRSTRKKEKALTDLLAEEQAIVAEERRMFGFLHELGEAITREEGQSSMYRLIVEGAMRVTDCTGGALYLLDAAGKAFVPRYFSDACVPTIDLPQRIESLCRQNPGAELSFLRLHSIPLAEGLVGRVYAQQKARVLHDLRREAKEEGLAQNLSSQTTALIGPLSFGDRRLGVLVLTASREQRHFSNNDFEVFNSLVEQCAFALGNAMAHKEVAEKKHIDAELRSASEIQRILLPERDPELKGFSIAGRNLPARVLSGDYYDFVPLGDGNMGAVIADVSGKGTAAAIITAMCRSVLRCNADSALSPASTLASVNRHLAPDIREDMFISMIYLILKEESDQVTLSRAGHTLPLLWRKATGKVEALHSGGLAVGIDKGAVFERVTKDLSFTMQTGDCLLLYTDGVNEALDAKGLEYGEHRLYSVLSSLATHGPQAVVNGIVLDVEQFLGGQRSHDDITLIAIQKTA